VWKVSFANRIKKGLKKMRNFYYKSCAIVTVMFFASKANAQGEDGDFGGVVSRVKTNISEMPTLIAAVAYIAALAMGVSGILKLREYMDKPETGLKGPIGRLLVAGLLAALPTLISMVTKSTVGGEQSNLGVTTFGTVENIGQ
jgi:hypothetical protein